MRREGGRDRGEEEKEGDRGEEEEEGGTEGKDEGWTKGEEEKEGGGGGGGGTQTELRRRCLYVLVLTVFSSFVFAAATQNKVAERNSDMKRTALNLDFSNSTRDEGEVLLWVVKTVHENTCFNLEKERERPMSEQ